MRCFHRAQSSAAAGNLPQISDMSDCAVIILAFLGRIVERLVRFSDSPFHSQHIRRYRYENDERCRASTFCKRSPRSAYFGPLFREKPRNAAEFPIHLSTFPLLLPSVFIQRSQQVKNGRCLRSRFDCPSVTRLSRNVARKTRQSWTIELIPRTCNPRCTNERLMALINASEINFPANQQQNSI